MSTGNSNPNINRGLNGIFPLSYMGVNPSSPAQTVFEFRAPTPNDAKNFLLGCLWIWQTATVNPSPPPPLLPARIWMLTALAQGQATWTELESGAVQNILFVEDSGSATPNGIGTLNVNGLAGGNITTAGSGNIITIAVSGTTDHAVQLGNATGSLTSVVGVGTAGQVLTSNGAGVDPTWQANAAVALTFDGDTGTATEAGGIINFKANATAGSSVSFSAAGNTVTFNDTDANSNTIVGLSAGNGTLSGNQNVSLGKSTLHAITTGSDNIALGYNALSAVLTGASNTVIGSGAGTAYVGAEGSNILIGKGVAGTAAESNVLRIGSATGSGSGQLAKAFISGIDGVNVGSTATIVTESNNQLGTAVITAGTGITVTTGANTITITATGSGTDSSILGIGSATIIGSNQKIWLAPFSGNATSTQADAQFSMPKAGTVSNLYVNVGTSTTGSNTTITVNKNGSNTSIVATTTTGTTGVFTDLVHTATFAAGDTIQFESSADVSGTATGTISVLFTAT